MRRVLIAGMVLLIGVGAVMADQFGAIITKVDGNKVTFVKFKKGEKGEEMTLSAQGAKVSKGKFNKDTKKLEAGDAVDGGLKNELFAKPKVFAQITTEGDKITDIVVGGGKGFKKKKKDN